MDNSTLRALVIKFRERGMTYQDIADKLRKDYDIKRSRQTLQGMYTRAMRDIETGETKERLIAKADIVNIFSLGYNMKEVRDIVNTFGYNLSYSDVVATIKDSQEYIDTVRASMANRVEQHIDRCKYIYDLEKFIEYNNIKPTDKQLKLYVAEAYKIKISKQFNDITTSMKNFTDDKSIEKKVIEDLSLSTLSSTAKKIARKR